MDAAIRKAGAVTATEVFLGQLKDGGGDIVNILPVAGRTARAGNGVYAATKWGLNGWSESLRQELLPDVRVTLIEKATASQLPPKAMVTVPRWLMRQRDYDGVRSVIVGD